MSADFQTLCSFHKNSWDQEGWNKANWVHACTYWMWESTFWYSKTHTDIPHSYIIYSYADKQVQQDRLLAVAHAALRPRQFKRLADRTATNEDVVKFKKTLEGKPKSHRNTWLKGVTVLHAICGVNEVSGHFVLFAEDGIGSLFPSS